MAKLRNRLRQARLHRFANRAADFPSQAFADRKRLRNILDRVKPAEHGLIVRTAAEHATEHELRADMTRLLDQWNVIEAKAKKAGGPALLYREPELAVRVIREEFNAEYRGVVIDDVALHTEVHDYVQAFNPELADRVEYYDAVEDGPRPAAITPPSYGPLNFYLSGTPASANIGSRM